MTTIIVHLESPVKCTRATTGKDRILHDLVIATRSVGEPLTRLATITGRLAPAPFPDGIVVGIVNLFVPHVPDDPLIDFSEGEYFALGRIKRAQPAGT